MVIWLIGISGAGKTTLGKLLKEKLIEIGKDPFLIDGDEVRNFFDNDLGYTKEEREENIKRIIYASHLLSLNGKITIVCNISPFQKLRNFCRDKLSNYIEIYLEKDFLIAKKNDVKGIYKDENIVGYDINFEKPISSDLTLNVDKDDINECIKKIIIFLKNKLN